MNPESCPAEAVVDCAVVVVTYNSARYLSGLLDSLRPAAGPATLRTIIVDNGSSDDTVAIADGRSDVVCVRSPRNLGYAGAINVGRRLAGNAKAILVLNPDVRCLPESIAKMLKTATDVGVGIVLPQLVDESGGVLLSLRREPTLLRAVGDALFGAKFSNRPAALAVRVHDLDVYEQRADVDWATGAAMLLTQECDRSVGDWDESYFMYSEEVAVCRLARDRGFAVRYVPNAKVLHFERGSGRSGDLDALRALNQVRYFRHHHGRLATGVFRLILALHEVSRFWSPGRRRNARIVMGWQAPPRFPGATPVDQVPWW